jgi:signal transduction histidine kinase
LRDITERKQAESVREKLWHDLAEERAQLKQLTETLEKLVEQRTEQVRSLASVLTLAEQQERSRISQILHDELQQLLYSLELRLNLQVPTVESATLKEQLEKMIQTVDQAIRVTRTLVVELNPPVLQSAQVNEALWWVISYMKEGYDLHVDFSAQEEYQLSDQDVRALLIRMVRELLFNVVKHAGTHEAQVKLWREDQLLLICVEDRGYGFDLQSFRDNTGKSASGFGLSRMDERLNLIGGRLEIESAPGQGSRITIMIPV